MTCALGTLDAVPSHRPSPKDVFFAAPVRKRLSLSGMALRTQLFHISVVNCRGSARGRVRAGAGS